MYRIGAKVFRPALKNGPPRATLATSQTSLNFFQKLKENIKEESSQDQALKEAQRKAKQQIENIGEEYNPLIEKSQKIRDEQMSAAQKQIADAKKAFNEKMNQAKEAEWAKKMNEKVSPKLKFKVDLKGLDPRQIEEVKATAAAAELLGQGLFGVMDIDPAYKRPEKPRMRHPEWLDEVYVANEDDTGVSVHASNRWNKTVDGFRESGLGQRMANFQAGMADSNNTFVRGATMFIWKIKEHIAVNRETGIAVEEIQRMEKDWSQAQFCVTLTDDFLPNILEAACQGDEEIVEDWCTEAASGVLMSNKKIAAKEGMSYQRHIYALSDVEFMDASLDEENDFPTVMVSFNTQEIVALINSDGVVVDGSLDKPHKVNHIACFARDMEEINPRAAWRMIETQSSATEMTV